MFQVCCLNDVLDSKQVVRFVPAFFHVFDDPAPETSLFPASLGAASLSDPNLVCRPWQGLPLAHARGSDRRKRPIGECNKLPRPTVGFSMAPQNRARSSSVPQRSILDNPHPALRAILSQRSCEKVERRAGACPGPTFVFFPSRPGCQDLNVAALLGSFLGSFFWPLQF